MTGRAPLEDVLTDPATDGLEVAAARRAGRPLSTIDLIAADYDLVPLPPGVLAVGLLAAPDSAACRALLDSTAVTHARLLEIVQDDLLDVTLEGLDDALLPDSHGIGPRLLRRMAGRRAGGQPAAVRRHGWVTDRGALDLLADAVDHTAGAGDLNDLLASMLLDGETLRHLSRELHEYSDVPAGDVQRLARRRFDTDLPDPSAIVVAVALSGSARVAEALRRLALTPDELAAQVAEYRVRVQNTGATSARVFRATILNGLLTAVTSVLVIRAAFEDGAWWKLLFLWLVWTGYPQFGPIGSGIVAAILALVVSPLAGLSHLIAIVADAVQAYAERRALLARTGVRVTLTELRHVTMRLLNSRARRVRSAQQRRRAFARAVKDGRTGDLSG